MGRMCSGPRVEATPLAYAKVPPLAHTVWSLVRYSMVGYSRASHRHPAHHHLLPMVRDGGTDVRKQRYLHLALAHQSKALH